MVILKGAPPISRIMDPPTVLHYFLKNVILYMSVLQIIYLLTITLTAILITGTGSLALPPVSYIKSVDIWNITSLIFITSCLLEVTVVSVLETRNINAMDTSNEAPIHEITKDSIQRVHSASNGSCIRRSVWIFHDQKNEHKDNDFTVKSSGESLADTFSKTASSENSNLKQANIEKYHHVHFLDRLSRFAFPFSFIIFNAVYWIYFLKDYITKDNENLAPYR